MTCRKQRIRGLLALGAVWASCGIAWWAVPKEFRDCHSLQACLKILDSIVPSRDDGSSRPEDKVFSIKLQTFGEPAKQALLQKAAGGGKGWGDLSGAILMEWRRWSPTDVPQLRAGLQKDPGGWLARPLAQIGTQEAIDALIEDLPKGSDNQTEFALAEIGRKAIPSLLQSLKDKQVAPEAQKVIGMMHFPMGPFVHEWTRCALNSAKAVDDRLACLRVLSAIGRRAYDARQELEPLLSDGNSEIVEQADDTLEIISMPVVRQNETILDVSLVALIANPLKYDKKRVRLIGFLRLEFEGNAIYLHREDFKHAITANGVWIDPPRLSKIHAKSANLQYVICEGVYKADFYGDMFSGSIENVSRLEPWSFERTE